MEKIAGEYFLTAREADVLLLLAKGYSQRGIAGKLDVSDNTVRTHIKTSYRKPTPAKRRLSSSRASEGEGVRGSS